ncbi:HEPN domain-containing protein [Leptolyngbya boryana CZ1]|uniref:HEPN domain-containing protein n=1 Tax=Leptolyngbya boryana CZ1 TaxID=3060204 RepID=A0AA96WYB0_LEPBY|nr:HEPN domain-containing protein [Leptolyngbya boryana]WNZ46394.1 HEPN domain-containing protein [Leptolyngbya boryana CZ1]
MEIQISKKALKTVSLKWDTLTNYRNYRKNYRIPSTIEELKEANYDNCISLQVNSRTWILLEEAAQNFNIMLDEIYQPRLHAVVSYQTIYGAIKKQLELELGNRETNPKDKRSFNQVLEIIQNYLDSSVGNSEYYFVIDGLELNDFSSINFGKNEVFLFDEIRRDQLVKSSLSRATQQDEMKLRRTQDFLDDNFLSRVCIKSVSYGDSETSSKRAYKQAKHIINYFRFIVCLLAHTKISQQVVRINISSESYSNSERTVIRRTEDNAIILVSGRGRKSLQNFSVDENLYQQILVNGYLKDFVEIIDAPSQTEIEGRILTAIYWIGEAQNEPDLDVAFIKYWTALESIFTGSKELIGSQNTGVTKSLAIGVAVLNAFSEYRFVEIENIKSVRSTMTELYSKRSDIIHRGMNYLSYPKIIDTVDVSEVCKYAAWSICSLFSLRSQYTTMSEINGQITRLNTQLERETTLPSTQKTFRIHERFIRAAKRIYCLISR